MKTAAALVLFVLSTSAFAGGSWKLNCVSERGISFYNDNGLSEIQFVDNTDRSFIRAAFDSSIENYDIYNEGEVKVKWLGRQNTISEDQENICHSDQIHTVFEQRVEITRRDGKPLIKESKLFNQTSFVTNVVCTEEIITGSGAEVNSCMN